jgi:hypothetical protein
MEQVFTKVIDLLYTAKQHGIEVILNNEKLQLKVAENKNIDKVILEQIKENKSEIIEFLSSNNWKSKRVDTNHNKVLPFNREVISHIPLSFSQERLWFIDRMNGSVEYNSPFVLRLKGKLDKIALERSLQDIVDRHEVLRTVFIEDAGKPFQHIKGKGGWNLSVFDGRLFNNDTRLYENI